VAKDRAAPFSKKHRRYWIPVTGGMVLIGAINVAIGFCTYEEPPAPQRMEVQVPGAAPPRGALRPADLPAAVMRAFAIRYPHVIPAGANVERGNYVVLFPPGKAHDRAVFAPDGTFVSEE
jgi:hypothetical protein